MRKLQIIETEHGAAVILPDELVTRLSLQDQTELEVEIHGQSIDIAPRAPAAVADVSTG